LVLNDQAADTLAEGLSEGVLLRQYAMQPGSKGRRESEANVDVLFTDNWGLLRAAVSLLLLHAAAWRRSSGRWPKERGGSFDPVSTGRLRGGRRQRHLIIARSLLAGLRSLGCRSHLRGRTSPWVVLRASALGDEVCHAPRPGLD
jgi:hypothetical protein